MDIAGLRQQRAALVDQQNAIAITASTTDEDLARHEALTTQIAGMDRRIAAAEAGARARAATAVAAPTSTGNEPDVVPGLPAGAQQVRRSAGSVYAHAAGHDEPGINFARMARSLIVAKGNVEHAARFAASTFGDSSPVAMEFGAALQTNDANSGGFLVPERFSTEIIDLLLPRTVIRQACAANGNVIPLVGGTDNIPTVESGTTAYYIGEGQDLTSSEPTFGNLKMVEREIAALVPISNKLLRHASVSVDLMVRNLIIRGLAVTEDLAFLRSTGVGPAPKGLRYLINPANVIASNATVNYTNIDTDTRNAELALEQANIPMIDPRWLMAPRTFNFLRDLRNANGYPIYPSLSQTDGGSVKGKPTWKGYPVEVTNQVPINLGGGGTDSEVYLVDFGFVVVADSYQVRIDASDTASYMQGGSLVSAFSKNQTVIRALAGHDFGMTRTLAAAVLTGIQWK